MGPRNLGNSKDPLVGHHDDKAFFHIPQENGPGIKLTGFDPFVTTRGTLYALFPSLAALRDIARMELGCFARGGTRWRAALYWRETLGRRHQTRTKHNADGNLRSAE